jgi:hypothetical protein
MRLSKLVLWNSVWVLLFAVGACLLYSFRLVPPHFEFADWPDGDTVDKDRWRSGRFVGRSADRIRRIERWEGDYLDAKDVKFLASVPMSQAEFEQQVRVWQAGGHFDSRRLDAFSPLLPHWPEWFPVPNNETYVGVLSDEAN